MRGVLFAQTGGANNAGICKSLLRVSGVAEHKGVYYQAGRGAMCAVRCGALGAIVHHKRPLTPDNIDDPLVSLNEKNLETLCRACHAIAHGAAPPIADGLAFDENGNVVEAALMPRPQLDDEFY